MSAVYELLAHPAVLAKVKAELAEAIPDATTIPSFSQIDNLPYFSAAIQEVLRLHPGVMNRQVRISPEVPIVYDDKRTGQTYTLPPGTVYSMSPLLTHSNEDVFPQAREYRPERWLENPKLGRYFLGFSHGTRSCVG
jgi:cytochrome P450